MKRPLVSLTIVFCLGILISSKINIRLAPIYISSVIFLALTFISLKKGLRSDIFLLCLVFSLGALYLKNSQVLPLCHISRFAYYKNNNLYTIKGMVQNAPLIKNKRTSFIFKAEEIQINNLKNNCCGSILVYVKGEKDLRYGEELILKGRLYRPFSFTGNKRNSFKNYLSNQQIYSIMNIETNIHLVRLNKNRGFMIKKFALWVKARMEEIIFKHLSYLPASIIDAMVLGERKAISPFINNSMIKTGTVHILVVSGFNVGIVAFVIVLFLKLFRLPRNLRLCIAIFCLIVYCLLTGASTPVVRATVMSIVFLLALLIKRESDIYNSCCLAAILILLVNPRQLFDIGFQLSFVSVISIICLYPKLKSFLRTQSIKIKYLKIIAEVFLVSLSAWLGTLGFIAYHFKIFSPITVLANIFIVPLATLITLCGFSLILMGLVYPPLAIFFASASELVVALLLKINAILIKLPGAYFQVRG